MTSESPTPGRTIAIGDIHGCLAAFLRLIDALDLQPEDTLVTLGDYVDRGPDTRGVIERLLELESRCRLVTLLGNHEEMLLGARDGTVDAGFWLACGGLATLSSYGAATSVEQIPGEHLDFLENCRLYYEQDTHFFVHANYLPDVTLDEQGRDMLLWRSLRAFTPGPHYSGKTAVVGHTCQPDGEIYDLGYLKCIDTCCYRQGWLTAFDVASGHVWQANQDGDLRS
ncbi:MAG TPA: metallophosphoesterase family protein [Pirellulales bacterium]|nr:metallophosphoesterase family protein [Pirellulales bacterium]